MYKTQCVMSRQKKPLCLKESIHAFEATSKIELGLFTLY